MANRDAPMGLIPRYHLNGSPYNGASNLYYVPATDPTAIFVGDAVKSAGSADSEGVPDVAQALAGDTIRGVVVGVMINGDDLSKTYRPASTEAYLFVVDDPDVIFEIQEDSDVSTLAAANVGNNADIIVGAGSTVSGLSGMELDSSSAVATTAQLRIHSLERRPDNEIGNWANWLVVINEHELKSTVGV